MVAGGYLGTPEQGAAGGQGAEGGFPGGVPQGRMVGTSRRGWRSTQTHLGMENSSKEMPKDKRLCQEAAPEQAEQCVGSQGVSFSFAF